ncbi:MAG: N-6 DNA methylase [Clostridia bacterium]|nr:N-6 DNA methylase [Clostridia bacterium]
MSSKEELVKVIGSLSGKYSPYQIFSDFCKIFALAISNACAFQHDEIWQEREEAYKATISRYDEKEVMKLVDMMDLLIEAMGEEMTDTLGQIYMQSGAGNSATGQFFTPFHLSLATAEVGVAEGIPDGIIKMNEPSCGGGGMIIATARVLKERGINYQSRLRVVAQDLDWLAVYMTYIQLSLYGIDAIVCQGDTLMQPYKSGYPRRRVLRTPRNAGVLIPGWEV